MSKAAICTLELVTTKKKATFNIYIQRTSDEIFSMGNSSFLVNLSKTIFKNGKLEFACKKYSTKGYEPIEFKQYSFGCFGIQLRCNTLGRSISDQKEKICSVVYDYSGNPSAVTWRLIDTAVVTPNFETVDTTFFINLK